MKVNVYFNSYELTTLGDFLDNERISPAFSYKENPKEFLDLEDKKGVSNLEKIRLSYNGNEALIEDLRSNYSLKKYDIIALKPPTTFVIESSRVDIQLFDTQGDSVQNVRDVNLFIAEELSDLLKNPEYKSHRNQNLSGNSLGMHPKMTVWVWSKVLNQDQDYGLINLSPFLSSFTVSSVKEGGTFSFGLPPILGEFKGYGEWRIKKSSFREVSGDTFNFVSSSNAQKLKYLKHPVNDSEGRNFSKEIVEENLFFERILSSNDLIFISFEDLGVQSLQIENSQIKGKNWDMMGFIDSVENSISVLESGTSMNIELSGRDFTKPIIEDGSYFFATEFGLDGTFRFAGNRDERIMKRLGMGENSMSSYFTVSNKSIEYALKFIISQIANTGYVPDKIFESYGEERSSYYEVSDVQGDNEIRLSETISDGIWGLVKIIIDPSISDLRLVNTSLFTEQGSLINYIQSLCQEPFVEFYTETIKDKFYWIARRPPWNKESILNSINGVSYLDFQRQDLEDRVASILRSETALNEVVTKTTDSYVIDILSEEVYQRSLSWEEEVYTWFKLEPRFLLGGSQVSDAVSLSIFPAIFLPSYVKIWGSKPMQQVSSYINYIPVNYNSEQRNRENSQIKNLGLLKWMIETAAYLPFTRRGSITITENRKIKKNMHIRFRPTGEIFLVDSVVHTGSISENSMERKTRLNVSRGMVEDYIEGVEIEGVNYSYFSLVDLPISFNQTQSEESVLDPNISNWRENEEVFNFFLKRKQFKDE